MISLANLINSIEMVFAKQIFPILRFFYKFLTCYTWLESDIFSFPTFFQLSPLNENEELLRHWQKNRQIIAKNITFSNTNFHLLTQPKHKINWFDFRTFFVIFSLWKKAEYFFCSWRAKNVLWFISFFTEKCNDASDFPKKKFDS